MTNALASISTTLAAAEAGPIESVVAHLVEDGPMWWALIPLLPLLACVLCTGISLKKLKTALPAWLTVAGCAGAFVLTLFAFLGWNDAGANPTIATVYEWVGFSWGDGKGESFSASFGLYMDGLSWLWMLFVTGLATLIALYASEYMNHDIGKGYGRFFGAFALFVFSMACLVMGDNLLMLYLGWEGVGLCSYLLIGYFYKKPEAVAAAKKAFIVNRIGDLGLAIGLFLTFTTFGSIEYAVIFDMVERGVDGNNEALAGSWQSIVIPCLLMIGAFGKSAQFPLYVWLPDAMEGPTPVSALIHAATMVTAGIYLIARFFPVFTLDPDQTALTIVAWVGAITAFLAATIGMAQFDIKRIMAYSTVSQLGYMFAGLGVMTSTGAVYHVFTHAFFKAMLFLACGAVMHGFAGQLDLRKLSGLWSQKGWKITTIAMFIGCLNLAGFPFTAGYWSKDIILAESFARPGLQIIGWILLLTAGMTAYYTFRVFFRVFVGPVAAEPGDELHDHDDDHDGEEHHHDTGEHGDHHHHGFHPHPPGWAINGVLGTLAVLTLAASATYFVSAPVENHAHSTKGGHGEFVTNFVERSSADQRGAHKAFYDQSHGKDKGHSGASHDDHSSISEAHSILAGDGHDHQHAGHSPVQGVERFVGYDQSEHHASLFGKDPHKIMYYVSAVVGLVGILIAAFLHGPRGFAGLLIGNRTEAAVSRADSLLPMLGPIPKWAQNKWYVDELYHFIVVAPLWVISNIFHMIDKLIVDGLVNALGMLPRGIAMALRPSQNGILHTYATGMALGLAIVLAVVWALISAGGAG
ncbi:MAG: NADH-quinone oxidoreductase subunit L [Planctomycetota bacterium]